MDVLLSLPILSYFLAPAMTSWSTSLNLLFFYMTWTTLVLSHSPLRIELVGVLAIRTVLYLVPSLLFLLFDTLLPSLAESIKFNGASALPPRDARALAQTLGLVLSNLALETAAQATFSLSYAYIRPADWPVFKTSTTLPLPWGMMKHIALLLAARECLTYLIHRYLLHNATGSRSSRSRASSRLAGWHAQYAHARRSPPYSLLLYADHPAAFLLHRFVPLYLSAVVVRPHLLTFMLYAALATAEETLTTSGYSIVPGIIMGGMARRSAVHYCCGPSSSKQGNFGGWGFLDWVCGTSLGKDVMSDVRDEAEKHRVKERGEKTANDGFGILQDGIEGLRRSQRSRKSRRADS